jgi:hypothetical protein
VREIIDQSANIMGNFVFLDLARGLDRDPGQQAMSARDALDIIRIMILAVAGARLGRHQVGAILHPFDASARRVKHGKR